MATPESLGAYRVLGTIGEGGMGMVLRARHRSEAKAAQQGGDVALKLMHPQFSRNPKLRARFETEAELGMRLEHPGIARVFDLVVDGENLALVMELIDGRPLDTGHPWPLDRALEVVGQIAEALAHAHDRGVVHRDIKPDNVLMASRGPVVVDFGIARAEGGSGTRTGTAMGTIAYMAPEQYQDAAHVDARADVYALGMVTYELLAGGLPWPPGLSEFRVLSLKAAGDLRPLQELRPGLPPDLVHVVDVALATDPEDRFATARAFAGALRAAQTPAAPPPAPAFAGRTLAPSAPAEPRPAAHTTAPTLPPAEAPTQPPQALNTPPAAPPRPPKAPAPSKGGSGSAVLAVLGLLAAAATVSVVACAGIIVLAAQNGPVLEKQGFAFVDVPPGSIVLGTGLLEQWETRCSYDGWGNRYCRDVALEPALPPWALSHESARPVTISRPFRLSRTEVTQALYQEVTGANPTDCFDPEKPAFDGCAPDKPVQNLSWYEAITFCNQLSEREGLTPYYSADGAVLGGMGYRLPTEAEWEYAARAGGAHLTYPGEQDFPEDSSVMPILMPGQAWTGTWLGSGARAKALADQPAEDLAQGTVHPVGQLLPNALGLYDMAGNVQEWVFDAYSAEPPGGADPVVTVGSSRVAKGGSFVAHPMWARAAERAGADPGERTRNRGFRIAQDSY